jgi:23S rRNA (adenine2503-C2)-methyltransferase
MNIAEMDLRELEAALEARGSRSFHARQIFQWLYRKGVTDFEQMTDLSRELRSLLSREFRIATPEIVERATSSDGTVKFLLELSDGRHIESVFIPDTPSQTFCISTQVGCAMKCGFCLTGKMGLVRNLTVGEIVGQVRVLARELGLLSKRFNIVLMGMGEPLHNYDNTMKALRILADPHGLAVSPRRVTLSTVGVVPGLERLATEPLMPNLAISLHATTEDQRDALVPVNRKYGLAEILVACRRFPLKRRSRITFEYVLLKEINDTLEDARRLVRALEVHDLTGRPLSSFWTQWDRPNGVGDSVVVIGRTRDRAELYERINGRVERMIHDERVLEEVRQVLALPLSQTARQVHGLAFLEAYVKRARPLDETVRLWQQQVRRYARRQLIWFRADPRIRWISLNPGEAIGAIVQRILELLLTRTHRLMNSPEGKGNGTGAVSHDRI